MAATEARESRSAKAAGWYARTAERVAADLGKLIARRRLAASG
jgi:hypothetical protein